MKEGEPINHGQISILLPNGEIEIIKISDKSFIEQAYQQFGNKAEDKLEELERVLSNYYQNCTIIIK